VSPSTRKRIRPHGEPLESCTILTTEANELMKLLHDRMPVILDPATEEMWLDPRSSADELRSLLIPYASERMEAIPVGPWVSRDDPPGNPRFPFLLKSRA